MRLFLITGGLIAGFLIAGATGSDARAQPAVPLPPGPGSSMTGPPDLAGTPDLAGSPDLAGTPDLAGIGVAPIPADRKSPWPPEPSPPDIASPVLTEVPAARSLPPVILTHPIVVNTARLHSDNAEINLFGIEGLDGEFAQDLRRYLRDQPIACRPATGDSYQCWLPDGIDVALAVLINGAAFSKPDAPNSYRINQARALVAHRGFWRVSTQPPVSVVHPVVRTTATLMTDDQALYVLDGLQGLRAPYTAQLQDYIVTHGDRVMCLPQVSSSAYVCETLDGMDIAKVALVNGAATVTEGAPDAYRVQQADAISHHRGVWATQPDRTRNLLACMATTDRAGSAINTRAGSAVNARAGSAAVDHAGSAAVDHAGLVAVDHAGSAPDGTPAGIATVHVHPGGQTPASR